MKRYLGVVCGFIFYLTMPVLAADNSEPSAEMIALAQSNNSFAFDVYAELKNSPGNIFFSPISIYTALAMTYSGAAGDTAQQMAKALLFSVDQEKLPLAFEQLLRHWAAIQEQGDIKLNIANSLWPKVGYPFLADYLALMKNNYGASITPLDYQKNPQAALNTINQWVAEKTANLINNLLGDPLPPSTSLLLINAVYFKGNWQEKFNPDYTKDRDFYLSSDVTIKAPFMEQTGDFNYGRNELGEVLELPYAGGQLAMVILLPADKTPESLQKVEDSILAQGLDPWRKIMRSAHMTVYLPKFSITWGSQSLKPLLMELGMLDPFGSRADFSGMTGHKDLYLDDVLHKAFVEVNEEGTEAAAATGVVMATKAALHNLTFTADHPFIFLIQDKGSGSILFLGRLASPQ